MDGGSIMSGPNVGELKPRTAAVDWTLSLYTCELFSRMAWTGTGSAFEGKIGDFFVFVLVADVLE